MLIVNQVMQYCQNLKPSERLQTNKPSHVPGKSRMEGESRLDGAGALKQGAALKLGLGCETEGKRLVRKKESWEDRIGMGQLTADESFKVKETQKIRRDYLKELMQNEVGKNSLKFRSKFLGRHKVSSEVRVRMVSECARV